MSFDQLSVNKIKNIYCNELGIFEADMSIIRIGENAMFEIPKLGIVLRVYRQISDGLAKAALETQVSKVLKKSNIPAIQLATINGTSVISVDGYVSTVWKRIIKDNTPVKAYDFGVLLKKIHEAFLINQTDLDLLKRLDPVEKIRKRIDQLSYTEAISNDVKQILDEQLIKVKNNWYNFESICSWQPIHGDAHTGNVIVSDNTAYICDFDGCCFGPKEWDLVPINIIYQRFLQDHSNILTEFNDAYGTSKQMSYNLSSLLSLRELSMVTWLAQDLKGNPDRMQEFMNRISSLNEEAFPFTAWKPN